MGYTSVARLGQVVSMQKLLRLIDGHVPQRGHRSRSVIAKQHSPALRSGTTQKWLSQILGESQALRSIRCVMNNRTYTTACRKLEPAGIVRSLC